MDISMVAIDKPDELNVVLGQAHFIKTVDDLFEALAGSSPHLRFGVAFCESSGPRLVRRAGNDPQLVELAVRNAKTIGAGHSFIVFLREGYPVNVLNQPKQVPEVCRIFCATANPVEVVVRSRMIQAYDVARAPYRAFGKMCLEPALPIRVADGARRRGPREL